MHPAAQKLAPADEANLVLDHAGQVNVFLAAGRLGVAAVSYGGNLCCGIHFDAMHVPGDVFASAIGGDMARLGRIPPVHAE